MYGFLEPFYWRDLPEVQFFLFNGILNFLSLKELPALADAYLSGNFTPNLRAPYVIISLCARNSPWIFIGGTLGVIPLAFLCTFLVAKTVPGIRRERLPNEGARWIASSIIPIATAIFISFLYSVLPSLWYGVLGASFLLAHLLIERPLISAGLLKARPFLLASIPILLTFPALLLLPPYIDSMIALGLCLLFYSLSGVYALARASKLFSE